MPTGLEVKDLVILVVGLTGGFLTNRYFFTKQTVASEDMETNLYALLDRNYDQALKNGVRNASILHLIQRSEGEVEPLSDLIEIKGQMEQVLLTLEELKGQSELPLDLVFKYKALGDRWSELASVQLELRVLNPQGKISFSRFKLAHKSIFPDNFPWAGELRKEHVQIVDTLGTVARIVDLAEMETNLSTIPPERIESNLRQLFEHWNVSAPKFLAQSSEIRISEVSHFHHELEMIHPFTDGNGRIGRMVLEEQLAFLFGSSIKFRPERTEYYRALRSLDMGNSEQLEVLIREALVQFNVAL